MKTIFKISGKKKIWFLLLIHLLLTPELKAQFSFNIDNVVQITYIQPFSIPLSNDIEVNYTYYNPPGDTIRFLNLYVASPSGLLQFWAAENLMMDTFTNPRTLTYTINLSPLGISNGTTIANVNIVSLITDTVVTSPMTFPPTAFHGWICGTGAWLYGSGVNTVPDSVRYIFIQRPPNNWEQNDSLRKVTRGCFVPNLDLDSTAHNPTTEPGYAGDWNACAPTSCANSLQWLESRYPVTLNTGLTHRQKLDTISKLMMRKDRAGVFPDSIIKGKLAFIDKYKLPIHVKYQSTYFNDSCYQSFDTTYHHCGVNQGINRTTDSLNHLDFDWLFNEMANGEDVEMCVAWRDHDSATGNETWAGAHAVVITAVEDIHGVKRITIKDDSIQSGPGGTRERPLTLDSSGHKRFSQLKEWGKSFPGVSRTCVVTDFISESYDPTVTFTIADVLNLKQGKFGFRISGNPIYEGETAIIDFGVSASAKVRILVLDINGRIINTLTDNVYKQGDNTAYWNGKTANNTSVPPGMYFIEMTTQWGTQSAKIIKQ